MSNNETKELFPRPILLMPTLEKDCNFLSPFEAGTTSSLK